MNMTVKRLAEVLGVSEWPSSYDEEFSRFCAEWETIKNEPIIDEIALQDLVSQGFISADGVKDLLACARMIAEDEELRFSYFCVYYSLAVYRGPHQNELYIDPAPPALNVYRYTFSMLILTKLLIRGVELARRRGIPEESVEELKGAANGGLIEETGVFGTPGMFHWRVVCAFGTMYHCGAFRYEPERVPPGYRMLRRKADGKWLMLYTAESNIDAQGQFSYCENEIVFHTKASIGTMDGYLISPDGRVLDRYVQLSEDEWDVLFDSGDAALSYHIPADIAYTIEAAADSFRKAVEFYNTYFPEYRWRSIQSYSWLYSPQLRYMLSDSSKINRMNEELYLAPVPSGADGFYSFVFKVGADTPLEALSTDTTLKRGFISFVKEGGRAHNGFMYCPFEDVEHFDEQAHRMIATDMFD